MIYQTKQQNKASPQENPDELKKYFNHELSV